MNTALVTTGLIPFVIGSTKKFLLEPWLDGVPWLLTGGIATFTLLPAGGAPIVNTATISGYSASFIWTVIGPAGTWTCSFDVTDANGIRQVSEPFVFTVTQSP